MMLQTLQESGVLLFVCEVSVRVSKWWKFWNWSLCNEKQVMINLFFTYYFFSELVPR